MMLNLFKGKLVLLAGILFLNFAVAGFAAESKLKWLVDKSMLETEKLELSWQTELPIKSSENLERILITGPRLYVFTDMNYLFALNRETGNIIFSGQFAKENFPMFGFEAYGKQLYSVVGNRLIEIDSDTGIQKTEQSLGYGITCPIARNAGYFYVGGSDNRIHILNAKNKLQVLEIGAYDYSIINSIVATDNFVVFGTASGRVTCMDPSKAILLWKFDASDAIVGSLKLDESNVFFASKDTKVYKLNIDNGIYVWKYQTGAVLDTAPVAAKKMVYQYVNSRGLAAINKDTGKLAWEMPKALGLLTEIGDNAYVLTNDEKLVIMNNIKSEQAASLNFQGVTEFTSNVTDSKMYIADKQGRLACIQPIIKKPANPEENK